MPRDLARLKFERLIGLRVSIACAGKGKNQCSIGTTSGVCKLANNFKTKQLKDEQTYVGVHLF